jgi:hypothetical protein
MSREELPKIGRVLREKGHLAIPLIAVIWLLVSGKTPMRAALWAIALTIAASMLRSSTRISWRDIIQGLEDGARSALGVIIACATAGIIIGVVTKTGSKWRTGGPRHRGTSGHRDQKQGRGHTKAPAQHDAMRTHEKLLHLIYWLISYS